MTNVIRLPKWYSGEEVKELMDWLDERTFEEVKGMRAQFEDSRRDRLAMKALREQNAGYMQTIKQLERRISQLENHSYPSELTPD